jgi:hypothetical protein
MGVERGVGKGSCQEGVLPEGVVVGAARPFSTGIVGSGAVVSHTKWKDLESVRSVQSVVLRCLGPAQDGLADWLED